MIQSFKETSTCELFVERQSKRWRNIQTVALRRLDQMEAAINLNDLRSPPGNRLQRLSGQRAGQHSIRINDQFRICFAWKKNGAHDVEITNYH